MAAELPETYSIKEAAAIIGPRVSAATLWRRARETGEIHHGVPILDFGPRCLLVSRIALERALAGQPCLRPGCEKCGNPPEVVVMRRELAS